MINSNFSLFDVLLIDIETVPQYVDYSNLSDDNKLLFAGKISKTMPENSSLEEMYKSRAGILAEFGKIVCISTGYFYKDTDNNNCLKVKSIYSDNEKELLENFKLLIDRFHLHNPAFCFAGHNIKEFDIPFICRRFIINGIALPPALQINGAKPWEVKMMDTLQWWRFGDFKNYITLHLLASVLNVPTSKTDIDGSQVQDVYYIEKNLRRIVEYCQRDVIVVANILLRFQQMPILDPTQIVIL